MPQRSTHIIHPLQSLIEFCEYQDRKKQAHSQEDDWAEDDAIAHLAYDKDPLDYTLATGLPHALVAVSPNSPLPKSLKEAMT